MSFAGLFKRLRDSYTHIRLAILVTLLFTVLVATIFRTPSIIFMAALFFAAPLAGVLAGGFLSRGLTVARAVPETGSVGDIVSGRLSIANRSPWPAFLIHLRPGANTDEQSNFHSGATDSGEADSREAGAPHEYSSGGDNGAARGAGKDAGGDDVRMVNERASQATSKKSAARVPAFVTAPFVPAPIVLLGSRETIVPLLRAGERLEWAPQWRLQRRGVHHLPPARAGANDPLGLFSGLNARTASHEITVLPRPLRVERLSFLGGSQANPRTPQHAAVVAEALDFHGVRAWRPGEAIRRVHWKSTARTGALHVVEWEESLGRDLTLLLDARSFAALSAASTQASASGANSRGGARANRAAKTKGSDAAARHAAAYDEAFEAAVVLVASIAAHLLEGGHRFQLFCWQRAGVAAPAADLTSSNLFARRGATRKSTENDARRASTAQASSPASVSTTSSTTDAPVLCRHQARGAGDVGDTLRMLARLHALPDAAATTRATLSHLAMQAAPLLGRGDSVLLLASTLSDIDAAIGALQSQSPTSSAIEAQIIALDAASFQAPPHPAPSPDSSAPGFTAISHAMRTVRRGDSLAAALER